MPPLTTDFEAELFAACGFWKKFSGEVRRPASSWSSVTYWVMRVFLRGALFALSRSRPNAREPAATVRCEALLIYVTENQRRAFLPWLGSRAEYQTASQMPGADWNISWRECGWLMLRYFRPVFRMLMRRDDRALTLPWIEEFVRYCAGLHLARDLFDRAQPRAIVISNDHSGLFRAFIHCARQRGLPVIYTQHASIGRDFPPLDFDLSMLDGAQAYLHYCESGAPRGPVVITGRNRPAVDQQRAQAQQDQLSVGVATNWDDSILEWLPTLRLLGREFPRVTLRCHPAETRKFAWRLCCRAFGIQFDSGTLAEFLTRTSVLVSGMSGIILDGALRGIPSLIKLSALRTSERMIDYFSYQKFGLARTIPTLQELPTLVRAAATEVVDRERVGAYEAGIVDDPSSAKRMTLELFLGASGRPADFRAALARHFVAVAHQGEVVFVSNEYARLSARFTWLDDKQTAGTTSLGGA